MDNSPGSSPPSGRAKRRKKRNRKPKPKQNGAMGQPNVKGNGRASGATDWKATASSLQLEVEALQKKLADRPSETEEDLIISDLETENKEMTQTIVELTAKLSASQKLEMKEREKVKLRVLQHFWGQMMNFQTHCDDDKEKLEKVKAEYGHLLSEGVKNAK